MGSIFKQTQFIFNSTGEMTSSSKPFQLFSDENGTILNKNYVEYGVYNKIINLEFKKVFILKKHIIGFGDIVDWITTITKIKDLIIFITKGNCGCEKRRLLFNKWLKFYWFSFKFRTIYADDKNIIPQQKILLKDLMPISILESKQKLPNKKSEIKPITISPTQPPLKKSCGCRSKS